MGICCSSSADTAIKAGNSRKFTVSVIDEETKLPINISSFPIITYSLARSVDDIVGEILISKSLGNGITILPFDAVTNPDDNKYEIILDSNDTLPLKGNYYHESEMTDAAGNKVTSFCSDNVEICKQLP